MKVIVTLLTILVLLPTISIHSILSTGSVYNAEVYIYDGSADEGTRLGVSEVQAYYIEIAALANSIYSI